MDPPPHAVYCVSSTSEIMPMSRRKNNPPFPVTISDLQDPTGSTEGYQKAYVAIQEALQALAQKVCQPISYLHARSLEIAEEDDEVSSQYLNVVIGRIPSQFGNVNTPTTNFSILDEVGKPETILYQRCAQIILPGDRVPKGHFLGDAGGRPIALWHPTSRTLHLLWRPLQGDYPVTSLNYHAKLLGYLVRAHGVTLRRWARPIKKQQIKTANRTDVHTWLAKTRSWQERQLENSLAAWNEEQKLCASRLAHAASAQHQAQQALTDAQDIRTRAIWRRANWQLYRSLISSRPRGYQTITLDGERAVGITRPVTIHHRGRLFRLGDYRVIISLQRSLREAFRISNLTRLNMTLPHHPHVESRRHDICFGGAAAHIQNLVQKQALFELFQLLDEFLRSYNEGSPLASIHKYWDAEGYRAIPLRDEPLIQYEEEWRLEQERTRRQQARQPQGIQPVVTDTESQTTAT